MFVQHNCLMVFLKINALCIIIHASKRHSPIIVGPTAPLTLTYKVHWSGVPTSYCIPCDMVGPIIILDKNVEKIGHL